jgi:hypothetical protein
MVKFEYEIYGLLSESQRHHFCECKFKRLPVSTHSTPVLEQLLQLWYYDEKPNDSGRIQFCFQRPLPTIALTHFTNLVGMLSTGGFMVAQFRLFAFKKVQERVL